MVLKYSSRVPVVDEGLPGVPGLLVLSSDVDLSRVLLPCCAMSRPPQVCGPVDGTWDFKSR